MFNRISTYALQAAEHLPVEATHMLIAGAINFVVFVRKRNDYADRRRPDAGASTSIREVNGVDGRVLVQRGLRAAGRTARPARTRRSSCLDDLAHHGYVPETQARWA